MKKKIFLITTLILGVLSLGACKENKAPDLNPNPNPDSNQPIVKPDSSKMYKKNINLVNKSQDYTIYDDKLSCYFYENGNIPYVGVEEFITSLNGYYLMDDYVIDLNFLTEELKLSIYDEEDEYYIKFNAKTDEVTYNNNIVLSDIAEPEGIDIGSHFLYKGGVSSEAEDVVFELANYGVDILFKDEDVLLPFNFINSIFLEPNLASLFYNAKEFYFFDTYIDDLDDYYSIRNKELEGKKIPADILESRNNQIYFIMDNYYGLKNTLGIDSFKDYILSDNNLKKGILATNAAGATPFSNSYEKFMRNFFMTKLDELHTRLGFKSFYSKASNPDDCWSPYYLEDYGNRSLSIYEAGNILEELYQKKLGKEEIVRFNSDTAIIKFDSFQTGRNDEIYDEAGNVKADAYKYDTFYMMQKAFKDIKAHGGIQNVVIDLSNNGGGLLSSCYDALGYITDKDLIAPSRENTQHIDMIQTFAIDVDEDGDFTDNDAYTEFNYFVLVSNSTFSAANYFTSVCKDMGIATIIGEKSGGGQCGVACQSLIDGSTFDISGSFSLASATLVNDEYEFKDIEFGIEPDYSLDYNSYYDLNKLVSFIHSLA